jgi:hypothetical protein
LQFDKLPFLGIFTITPLFQSSGMPLIFWLDYNLWTLKKLNKIGWPYKFLWT